MADERDEFWSKKTQLEAQTKLVTDKLQTIFEASEMFRSYDPVEFIRGRASGPPWQWLSIAGPTGVLPGFPTYVLKTRRTLSAKTWPSLDEIATLLAQWHLLDEAYRKAWDALSKDQKEMLRSDCPREREAPERVRDYSKRY
jgi:hypothetical protein